MLQAVELFVEGDTGVRGREDLALVVAGMAMVGTVSASLGAPRRAIIVIGQVSENFCFIENLLVDMIIMTMTVSGDMLKSQA